MLDINNSFTRLVEILLVVLAVDVIIVELLIVVLVVVVVAVVVVVVVVVVSQLFQLFPGVAERSSSQGGPGCLLVVLGLLTGGGREQV